MKKQKYYSSKKLLKVDCDYYIIIGKRSNGKSFDIKSLCLKDAYENDNNFVYMRRWTHERTANKVEQYFADEKLFEVNDFGIYTDVKAWTDKIYFGKLGDKGKIEKDKLIGYSVALASDTHYKSLAFPNVKNIIFEEFITDSGYLGNNEPDIFMSLLSTIVRDKKARVFMIGNTINRFCPYFSVFGIDITQLKKGDIVYYEFNNNGNKIKVGIEYCNDNINTGKMILGNSAKMIDGGEWLTSKVPLVKRDTRQDELFGKYYVTKENTTYKCLILVDDTRQPYIFCYPYNKIDNIKASDRWFTDKIEMTSLQHSANLTMSLNCDIIIKELYKLNRICYSDSLTGTEFEIIRNERGWK